VDKSNRVDLKKHGFEEYAAKVRYNLKENITASISKCNKAGVLIIFSVNGA